jgi:integrase
VSVLAARGDAIDLAVHITAAERAALAIVTQPYASFGARRSARRILRRFLIPLDEAGVTLDLHPRSRREVQRFVLHGMQAYQTAWGCWDSATWIQVAHTAGLFAANVLAVAARFGAVTGDELLAAGLHPTHLARRLFGRAAVDQQVATVQEYLKTVGYGRNTVHHHCLPTALATLFVRAGRAELAAITLTAIEAGHAAQPRGSERRTAYFRLAHVLYGMGLLPRSIARRPYAIDPLVDVHPEWAEWCRRWRTTSTLAPKTIESVYYGALKAGRWLAREHPDVHSPDGWTRELALAYVATVNSAVLGDLVAASAHLGRRSGRPLSPRSKDRLLCTLRMFLRDCQEWGWCTRRFDSTRVLATPRAIKNLIAPNPRVIANDLWAKLLWAGLHLEQSDLPTAPVGAACPDRRWIVYPLALVKATAVAWLFTGLRSDELVRLRVGCIRWQDPAGGPVAGISHVPGDGATCLLDVPTNKTGTSYTKPVDPLVGDAIAAWEELRPHQPALIDPKTGERVPVLFCLRGRPLPTHYFNQTLIPILCRKAGVPAEDARGPITSHRARATIASQLYNAKEPMTLFELQAWLGHRSPQSTQHYARISPTTLAKAYQDAGYFARNVRTIEVLIDREAVVSSAAAAGQPWQYFDLGHGYCTYSFFEQCPHRMACARCDFYVPKDSTRAQLLESRENLQRMLAQIPLTDDERAAVEDGTEAVDRLLARLTDVPTPAGPTPRQLAESTSFIPLANLGRCTTKD